ncbi:MAG: hypothetical protein KDD76_02210, partial [Rickettsiales bacterium]|nr:hypothetical protein [Rickettsiales bacterium]
SLKGFVETLQTAARDDPEAQAHFLELMAGQAERMEQLVNDLLSLSKIEMNRFSSPTERVNIWNILEDVIDQERFSSDAHHITLLLNEPEAPLPKIYGDGGQLQMLFDNLVTNAIKYGKEGGKVIVSMQEKGNPLLACDGKRLTGRYITVDVIDDGIGIPREHIPRLTERFYRVNSTKTHKISVTGLGLAIVKHILERHGGYLDVVSSPGKGSTFTVLLPIVEKTKKQEKSSA